MKHDGLSSRLSLLRHAAVGLAATVSVVACSVTDGPSAPEPLGRTSSAVFANGGFETGANGQPPPSWTVNHYLNNGIVVQTPQTVGGLQLQNGGVANTIVLNAPGGPNSQNDQAIGNLLKWPRYGNQCAIVNGPNAANQNTTGANKNVNELSQTMTVGAGDVDPLDGQVHVRFAVAPVLMNPAHTQQQQPYYMVVLTNVTKGTTLYSDFNLSGAGIPWQTTTVNGNVIDYTAWQLIDVSQGMSMGDQLNLQIYAAGCSLGAHWGEIYVDGVGPTVPGLAVQAAGPAQANAGANVTYTLTYRNGSASTACTTSANCSPNTEACVGGVCAETNVQLDFTIPANTTFQSITPPAGATCTTLPVGGTGTITCTFTNPVPPGTSGTFTVTVNINGGATGEVNCAAYDIKSNQETPLNGPPVVTNIGCTADAQCSTGQWCNETAKACDPTLANGQPIPNDPAHTNPTLNGTCTAQAGTLVCTSGVCDTKNNECGYENGDGPCTTANGGTVCDSGVCDGTDNLCGYANGDGPCTSMNGGTVCRSGVCSANGNCMAAGSCNVDADCTGGDWCDESTHTCTPKLANGQTMPNDPPHMNPTLNGMCSANGAALVCASGVCDMSNNECGFINGDGPCTTTNGPVVCDSAVCDKDDLCGYANGDGPCTAANGGVVCRSGQCSSSGTCEPAGGCNVDADCTGGNWCNESTHTCTPKLANGQPIPTDPAHMNPTLNGMCTAQAGTLVCSSGVCDTTNNECGYANGDGPCVAGNGSVCQSGVCDMDGKCGYANGDGPCTTTNGGTVCRSGMCSTGGTCEPAGGCNTDADCMAGQWCNESTHMCTATLANGQPIPKDPPHMNPTLDGMCSAGAGTLVCTSGVCDTKDNECGYANGDGPCTMQNGGSVCRSGMCSSNGTCEPSGGCNTDADCMAGQWCDESMHQCTARLANGQPIPSDPPHMNPTLDGMCTSASGLLVCLSGVCDSNDNECGYANGDGPCTMQNGGTVCRSGMCGTNGTCEGPDAGSDGGKMDAGGDASQPDGSTTQDAGKDAAPSNDASPGMDSSAGTDSGNDASEMADSTTNPDATPPDGFVEGGGLSCAMSPPSGAPPFAAGALGVLAFLAARRRSRSVRWSWRRPR